MNSTPFWQGTRWRGVFRTPMEKLTILIVMFVAILGPSAVIAATGFSAIRSLGRNPSSSSKIMMAMIVTMIFAEAIAIIALIVLFNVMGK